MDFLAKIGDNTMYTYLDSVSSNDGSNLVSLLQYEFGATVRETGTGIYKTASFQAYINILGIQSNYSVITGPGKPAIVSVGTKGKADFHQVTVTYNSSVCSTTDIDVYSELAWASEQTKGMLCEVKAP